MATAIIPARDEAPRIGQVLAAVAGAPCVRQVLVVDDGSTDWTAEAAGEWTPPVRVLRLERPAGKGGAIRAALPHVTEPVTVLLDADLQGLRAEHVEALVGPVERGEAEMAVGGHRGWGAGPLTEERALQGGGQRALPTSLLRQAHLAGYGVEAELYRLVAARGGRMVVVALPGVSNPSKVEKWGFWRGVAQNLQQLADTALVPRGLLEEGSGVEVFEGGDGEQNFIQNGITVPVWIVTARGRRLRTIAQVDTGSTICSVDTGLIAQLGVLPTGSVMVGGIAGDTVLHTYALQLQSETGITLTDGPVLGAVLPPPVQALIGRDVLARIDLSLLGPSGQWIATEP